MSNTYTVKTVIIPNPTLAAHFHCLRERASLYSRSVLSDSA